jgi:hypothetical protein
MRLDLNVMGLKIQNTERLQAGFDIAKALVGV